MDEAGRDLTTLAVDVLKFIIDVSATEYTGHATAENVAGQSTRLLKLKLWYSAFQAFIAKEQILTGYAAMIMALSSQYYVTTIVLRNCLNGEETAFNVYYVEFGKILSYCQNYILLDNKQFSTNPAAIFTFDTWILPQPWFVALKGRHRQYRIWPITLLSKLKCREGMWSPFLYHGLAKRVMQIEDAPSLNDGHCLPREIDRLWSERLDPLDMQEQLFQLSYKPVELGGRGTIWKEFVELEETASPMAVSDDTVRPQQWQNFSSLSN